jgi:hypothetical protein
MKTAAIFVDAGHHTQSEALAAYILAIQPDFRIVTFTAAPVAAETGIA